MKNYYWQSLMISVIIKLWDDGATQTERKLIT